MIKECLTLVALLSMAAVGYADLAVNFMAPTGRGDKNTTLATAADFIGVSAASLDSGLTLFNADPDVIGGGNGGAWNHFNTPQTYGGLTISTTSGANGFNASDDAHTDEDPILDGYAFGTAGQTVTISGLAAQASVGDTVVISAWGLGDNVGQDSDFDINFAGTTLSGSTLYNSTGIRNDPTGSIPAVHLSFVSDGSDVATIDVVNSGHFNAFSVGIVEAIPEPGSAAFLLVLGATAAFRRRKK